MRWQIPLVAVLALFVAVSCDQQLVEPAADQVAEAPAFNWMNNPDNGNIKVYRDAFDWIACWTDVKNGLRACHGTIPIGAEPEPDCGLQQAEAPVDHQDVGFLNPDDFWDNALKAHGQGDVWITIRDKNTAGDCFGDALVAEGWGHFAYNDNNSLGAEGFGNTNTWKHRGHGNDLTAPDGSRVNYSGHVHYHWNMQKEEFRVLSAKVGVR